MGAILFSFQMAVLPDFRIQLKSGTFANQNPVGTYFRSHLFPFVGIQIVPTIHNWDKTVWILNWEIQDGFHFDWFSNGLVPNFRTQLQYGTFANYPLFNHSNPKTGHVRFFNGVRFSNGSHKHSILVRFSNGLNWPSKCLVLKCFRYLNVRYSAPNSTCFPFNGP